MIKEKKDDLKDFINELSKLSPKEINEFIIRNGKIRKPRCVLVRSTIKKQ